MTSTTNRPKTVFH